MPNPARDTVQCQGLKADFWQERRSTGKRSTGEKVNRRETYRKEGQYVRRECQQGREVQDTVEGSQGRFLKEGVV